MAGCTWTAHAILGRPGNNPYCVHRQIELAKQGIAESISKVAPAPGTPFDYGRFELVHKTLAEREIGQEVLGLSIDKIVALDRTEVSAVSVAQIRRRLRVL